MQNSKKYIAPDMDYISFDYSDELTTTIISSVDEDPTHDAIIDWR